MTRPVPSTHPAWGVLLWLAAIPGVSVAANGPSSVGGNPNIGTRSGLAIHEKFRSHLAEPECANASPRWRGHFAHAPKRLASEDDELLALFGYVVDELVKAGLPTEYALIPFVESGYKPGARSGAGPTGLWQFIAMTARNQGVPMRDGYDGRLSVIDSTRGAVRYLKILHSMFGGRWRVAIMAYNAGEYRLVGAIRRSGQAQRSADAARIQGIPSLTRAYVEKLHAISCLLEQADDRKDWLDAIDRPVPLLVAEKPGEESVALKAWARARGLDAGLLVRLNPALSTTGVRTGGGPWVLAPARVEVGAADPAVDAAPIAAAAGDARAPTGDTPAPDAAHRTYTVAKGDSWARIARRQGLPLSGLLRQNGASADTPLRPGMVLKLDATRP